MRKLYALFSICLCISFSTLYAQYTVNGAATVLSPGEFQLTPPTQHVAGSFFSNTPLNLTTNFDIKTQLYFGADDAGADGLAFILQAEGVNYLGNYGAGLGYHRFTWDVPGPVNSFIVEFDTYHNDWIAGQDLADPIEDHLGFMSQSNAYHSSPTNLAAPVPFPVNIEDDAYHDARFQWNATTKIMTVTFLGNTYTYTGDIVNTLFGGNPLVYWGFTAGTGSVIPNVHKCKINCFNCPPPTCGQLRTQTPGGWGAPPRGNNPASYMYSHFAAAFPTGLTVGCKPNYNITLTSPQAVTNFLPSGGQAKKLTQNYLNPSGTSLKNVLAGHLVALTLSVRFDQTDPSFGSAGVQLGDMIIKYGAFTGWTVNNFLIEANKVLGGCSSAYSIDNVLVTAAAINENYVDGNTDLHFLKCPNETPRDVKPGCGGDRDITIRSKIGIEENVVVPSTFDAFPNPSKGQIELRLGNVTPGKTQVVITSMNGAVVESRSLTVFGKEQLLKFDLSKQSAGVYLVKIITAEGIQTKKIVIQK
jgi:hypothetical protein